MLYEVITSVSRLMTEITDKDQQEDASKLRNLLSVYNSNYDLVSIGAYKSGTNPQLDEALSKINKINDFLMQKVDQAYTYEEVAGIMKECIS